VLTPGSTQEENITIQDNGLSVLKGFLKASNTEKLGTYSFKCILRDLAGTFNISVINLTSTEVVYQGSSAAAIPGFVSPVGKIKIGSGTVSDAGRLTTEGSSRLIKKGGAVKFDIKGEIHKVEVSSASKTSVTLKITSTPMDVTIDAGESEEVDVNGDGVSDIKITYHKLFANSYADLTFELISEPVKTKKSDESPSPDAGKTTTKPTKDVASPSSGLTITLAVIVIILIIGYALIKGKKK
jgi:hypothetical protein